MTAQVASTTTPVTPYGRRSGSGAIGALPEFVTGCCGFAGRARCSRGPDARVIGWTGGRIRRSFVFTGGMPLLVLTLGYLPFGGGYAVIASNAGSDRVPAWWLNLQADPAAEVLADRTRRIVRARRAIAAEDDMVWAELARLNPGQCDDFRPRVEFFL
jgi:deazaflavin-dependent oxidoreductase (nitroreductase family)